MCFNNLILSKFSVAKIHIHMQFSIGCNKEKLTTADLDPYVELTN